MTRKTLITFDVYSALLDIHGGLSQVLSEATDLALETVRPLVATWRIKQMECAAASNSLERARMSFRDCTRLALDYVCARHDLALSAQAKEGLVFAWDRLPLWPEADAAMTETKAMGFRIAILSNGDHDMLEAVAGLFTTSFDNVLSSESAGRYKPHPSIYALPQELLGVAPAETLHVAGGHTDVLGAVSFGLPCVWSNKTGDKLLDPAFPPDHEIKNLSDLTPLLAKYP